MTATLRPQVSMFDVYGPDHVFVARAHDEACDWLPKDPLLLDSLTGSKLCIAGGMPIICSAGFDTQIAVDLLADAGLEFMPGSSPFRAGEALDAVSAVLRQPETKLVIQHAFPSDAVEPDRYWIDPELLRYLNNKANLPALVGAEHVPQRSAVDPQAYFSGDPELPVVLKAASQQSTGGGFAVMICRTSDDLRSAERLFADCHSIVAERPVEIQRNPCLNFAVMRSGEVRYLGFADQDISDEGKYLGNWLELGSTLPDAVIEAATEPVKRAAVMGYFGFAGVDVAISRDEHVYVLDLNFRLNSSTASVLLAPALEERLGTMTMHLRRIQAPDASALAGTAREFIRRGLLVPLALFDPNAAGYPDAPAVLQALVVGASRNDVLATEAEIGAAGSA